MSRFWSWFPWSSSGCLLGSDWFCPLIFFLSPVFPHTIVFNSYRFAGWVLQRSVCKGKLTSWHRDWLKIHWLWTWAWYLWHFVLSRIWSQSYRTALFVRLIDTSLLVSWWNSLLCILTLCFGWFCWELKRFWFSFARQQCRILIFWEILGEKTASFWAKCSQ